MKFLKNINKYDRNGIITTVLFHLILVVLFIFFFGFSAPYPPPPDIGTEVNLGYGDEGMGDVQPEEPAQVDETAPQNESSSANEELVTQNTEETPEIENSKDDNTETTESENKDPVVNKDAIYTPRNQNNENGGNEGETGNPGDQGNRYGDPDAKNHYGNPGDGNNKDAPYSLTGRYKKYLPKPEYNSSEQGKVVVEIYVNKKGQVTRAIAGVKGTTTSDKTLWKLSKEAALKAKFDSKPNAPEEQKGTITYNFIKLN